jgi:acetylornithine deacetylase/succinyl-diaminopimelate desuccinylase-like protein
MTDKHTGPSGLSLYGSAAREARAYLATREHRVLDIARRLVEAPSPNPPGDETAPADIVRDELGRLGLPAATVVARDPRRPNLIVRIEGRRPGPALALCGHLDTKPVGDAGPDWETDPLTAVVDGDRLIGLGSCDMKGAVSAMLMAGAAFQQVSHLAAGSLTLVFTADEENGSRAGAEYLAAERVLDVDALVLGEPSGVHHDWEALRTVSRGICGFVITVRGQQIHSSLSDELGQTGSVERLAGVLTELRRTLRVRYPEHALCPGGPTVNLGVRVAGGVGFGVLPGEAEVWGDIRTIPGMTRNAFEEDMHRALDPIRTSCPDVGIEFAVADSLGWLEPSEIAADHPAVLACQQAAREVLGAQLPLQAFPGGSDAWAFQGIAGIPVIAAFGPGLLPRAHRANEWVNIRSLVEASQLYVLAALVFGEGAVTDLPSPLATKLATKGGA